MQTIEENIVLNHLNSMPFEYREKLNIPNDISYGVEIEFMTIKKNDLEKEIKRMSQKQLGKKNYKVVQCNKMYSLNKDKSIYEIKTPVLSNTEEDFASIKQICQELHKKNVLPSNQKGIHIHVNLSLLDKNEEYLKTLLKLFCIYEHIIFRFSYGEDNYSNINISSFSREISTKLYNYLKIFNEDLSFDEHITRLRTIFNSKSYALNFHKKDLNCKNDTIEFRTFNSTVNPVIIQNDINLATNFINNIVTDRVDIDLLNYRMDDYNPRDYVKDSYSNMHLDDAIEFSEQIFNNNTDRDYFLRQYAIKNNEKIKKLVI